MSVPRVASTSLPLALQMLVLPVAQRLWMQYLQTKIHVDSFITNVNSLYTVARPSVCLSSVCLSVTLVHPTQAVVIFGNISTVFDTLAIR